DGEWQQKDQRGEDQQQAVCEPAGRDAKPQRLKTSGRQAGRGQLELHAHTCPRPRISAVFAALILVLTQDGRGLLLRSFERVLRRGLACHTRLDGVGKNLLDLRHLVRTELVLGVLEL